MLDEQTTRVTTESQQYFNETKIDAQIDFLRYSKQRALDAAISLVQNTSTKIVFGDDEEAKSRILKLAEEIYQWLIK